AAHPRGGRGAAGGAHRERPARRRRSRRVRARRAALCRHRVRPAHLRGARVDAAAGGGAALGRPLRPPRDPAFRPRPRPSHGANARGGTGPERPGRERRGSDVIDAVQIVPRGPLAIGLQLPVAAQSTVFAAPWEAAAGPAELLRIAQACDRAGFFYVAVCDHVCIPRSHAAAMSTTWSDAFATLG